MLSCVTVAMLCLLFGCLLLTDHSSGSKLKGTSLNVKEKELTLKAGQPLHLSCRGDQTLSWKFPAASRRENKRYHVTDNVCQGSPKMTCQRNLTVYKAQASDTGLYSCQYEYLTLSQNLSTVYIFVADENRPFVDMKNGEPKIINFNDGEGLVVPCRVTSPDIAVTLKQHFGKVLSQPSDRSIVWDSRRGFIIRRPSYMFFTVLLDCEAKVNGTVYTASFFINRQTSRIYNIQLNVEHPIRMLRNKSLTINCTASTDLNSRAEIYWTYPSLKFGKIASILKGISLTNSKAVVSSMLKIHKVENIDQGEYVCTAKNGPSSKSVNTTVRVHAPHIKVKPKKEGILEAQVGQKSYRIGIKVRAFPPPEITWWKNNLLAADKCARYIIDDRSLTIKDVAEEDAGDFTVVLRLKRWNLMKNLTMTLKVNAKPHIYEKSLSIQEPYPHVLGSRQTLICTVYAVPPAAITWTWHPCPKDYSKTRCDFHPANAIPVTVGKNSSGSGNTVHSMTERTRTIEGKNKTASVLVIDDSTTSGIYSCIASNKVGTERRDINFFVTDIPNGFHISVDKVPNEGENMTLTCSVNKYLYTNISWIMHRKAGNRTLSHSISKHRRPISGEYSTTLTTTVHNVSRAHSGVYECRATNIYNGDTISQSKEITIKGDSCSRTRNHSRTTKQRRKNCATDNSGIQ